MHFDVDVIVFLVFFLLPGLAILVFARRIIAYNARVYPRLYGRVERVIYVLVAYAVGVGWIVLGLRYFAER